MSVKENPDREKKQKQKQSKNNTMGENFPNLHNLSRDLSELITKKKEDYNLHLAIKLNHPNRLQNLSGKSSKVFVMGTKYH